MSPCNNKKIYSRTCVQRPPLGLKKVAVGQGGSLFTVYSYKNAISLGKLGSRLVIVDSGRWSEVVVNAGLTVQSNLSTRATLGTPKKRPLFRGGHYSKVSPIKLQLVWDVWGSGWSLLTGGCCSEVAVNTGLTVHMYI